MKSQAMESQGNQIMAGGGHNRGDSTNREVRTTMVYVKDGKDHWDRGGALFFFSGILKR